MGTQYSVEVCQQLEERFRAAGVHRPMRIMRHEAGTELTYQVRSVGGGAEATVRLAIERFVGGGFAGQVYQVKIVQVEGDSVPGVEAGAICAMKILIPPSGFSCLFRNLLYWIGFQGPFQLQVNPTAARAGALWQKLIRRGAKVKFGGEQAVVDIYGTFVDEQLGSCGELSEWVQGRTWLLEVDDRLDLLRQWRKGRAVDESQLGSPEYRAKRRFMRDFVSLLHEMGAHEFARQYEWSTCKSQPNCLKRQGQDEDPDAGLTAVDFRAGLTLLPLLPMSPGDIKLIGLGIARGSLVQFDRGSLSRLEEFVQAHSAEFEDMQDALSELKASERVYRDSIPDVTHNHVRLLYSRRLWAMIFDSAVTGWKVRNLVEQPCAERLGKSRFRTFLFFLIGCIPFLGKVLRRAWGRHDWRKHYVRMLGSARYFGRAFKARVAEKSIQWYRAGRMDAERALRLADRPWRFLAHAPFSILPAGLHRFLTDAGFAREKLAYLLVRPVRLYFNAEMREQWLREMLAEGKKKHMLSDEDAATIVSQLNEPFIQKYLKSLAVHVCTLPVTQVVSVAVAAYYYFTHPETPQGERAIAVAGILAFFQVVPLSPGSLTRGLYVLYLVIRERNFRDYNIAVFLGFFKYVGYLAFPIQMTYRYPALARFMAAHWATEAVHIVPVFGERGALMEHWVFSLFYNWPLTIRRRMRRRAELRASLRSRYWHIGPCALAAAAVFGAVGYQYCGRVGQLPALREFWWLVVTVPLLCGAVVTLGCGGAALGKRIAAAAIAGLVAAALATALSALIARTGAVVEAPLIGLGVWRVFIFSLLSVAGAALTELTLPEPRS
ncbi:MAG: hypothetical protein JW741_15415 [Sedimentisphaerales bacterium]|nr:hypothetical protein [Sedimentisphaerales bacterium]